jgi:transposase-like protein
MGNENRRKYDPEFKKNAVLLTMEPGRTVSEVAGKLGINKDLIYQWRTKLIQKGELAFPGSGVQGLTVEQKRIKELEKTLKDVEMERDILKKAMAIFSKAQ